MVTTLVVVLALAAAAQSSVVPVAPAADADYTSFSYGVADPYTGDFKSQAETRVGGNVVGQYSLLESDGTKRTVDYAADDYHGFNAVVRKDPVVAPVVAAAPVAPAVVGPVVAPARIAAAPAVAAHGPVLGAHAHVLAAPAPVLAPAPVVAAPAAVVAAPAVAHSHTVSTHTVSAGPGVYAAAAPVLSRTYAAPVHAHLAYAPHATPLAYW
ncbi:insect cuticle protein domain-containing protein [Phthorimaea operculella]|nr:insect cuticle protein domain-containing protein [Phthorimaea operculella]